MNSGTAGATSVYHNMNLPKYAFQNTNNYWYSQRGLPQSVWMQFPTPHQITKIGFSSIYNSYAPKSFDVVGSSNCTAPWTTLVRVDEAGFPDDWESTVGLTWKVPERNQQPFSCIGIKVETIWKMKTPYVMLKNIEMWEEAA